MRYIALKLLWGDRVKFLGLVFGIAFTSFMMTFALSYLAGFITRGFALIDENPSVDIWVMDRAVSSTQMTTDIPLNLIYQIRSIPGVSYVTPMLLKDVNIRYLNGKFQDAQMIIVDDASLVGVPKLNTDKNLLYIPNSVAAATGGTHGKLVSAGLSYPTWSLNQHMRKMQAGDKILLNHNLLNVIGIADSLPRYPPRVLLYTRYKTALQVFPSIKNRATFFLVKVKKGADIQRVIKDIEKTGLKARTSQQFKKDTVLWLLQNSEDVGDMVSMLLLAVIVGFGVTGIMLYMFTYENIKEYAILKAIGASQNQLISMIFFQAFMSATISVGMGIGFCALVGKILFLYEFDYPFRMMWFAPLVGVLGVYIISFVVALISIYPVLKMDPTIVFARR